MDAITLVTKIWNAAMKVAKRSKRMSMENPNPNPNPVVDPDPVLVEDPAPVDPEPPAPVVVEPRPFGDIYSGAAEAFKGTRKALADSKVNVKGSRANVQRLEAELTMAQDLLREDLAEVSEKEAEDKGAARALRNLLTDYIGE